MESSLPQSPLEAQYELRSATSSIRELRAWKKALRKDFPLPPGTRVYIKIRDVVEFDGQCVFAAYEWTGNRVTIQIERNSDERRMVSDLLHEWVHLLCPGEKQDQLHDEPFGTVMSQLTRWYDHGIRPTCKQFRPHERKRRAAK